MWRLITAICAIAAVRLLPRSIAAIRVAPSDHAVGATATVRINRCHPCFRARLCRCHRSIAVVRIVPSVPPPSPSPSVTPRSSVPPLANRHRPSCPIRVAAMPRPIAASSDWRHQITVCAAPSNHHPVRSPPSMLPRLIAAPSDHCSI